jgi:predicted DNA-binding transcriptional regulator YafY
MAESNQNCTVKDHILDGFLTEREFARQRGVSLRTCQRDRARRCGPPYVVIGRQVYYRIASTRAWLEKREICNTPDRAGSRRHAVRLSP